MSQPFRLLAGIALAGSLLLLGLTAALALDTSNRSLPFYRSVYVEAVVGAAHVLNPLIPAGRPVPSEADLHALLFEGLTRVGPNGEPEPALAVHWSSDARGRVYTFTLHPGLHWHDGEPLTAADVVFTIESLQQSGTDQQQATWRNVRVEARGSRAVRFTLGRPLARFLMQTSLPILPRHLLHDIPPGQWATTPYNRRPIGSGPFRIHHIDKTQAILQPFEGAVRGRPKLDLLVLRFYSTQEAALRALQLGEVQGVALTGASVPRSAQASLGVAEYELPIGPSDSGAQADEQVLHYYLDRDLRPAGLANRRLWSGASARFETINGWVTDVQFGVD